MAPYRICLIPCPITFPVVVLYFIYKLHGLIDHDTLVKYHPYIGSEVAKAPFDKRSLILVANDDVINDFTKEKIEKILFRLGSPFAKNLSFTKICRFLQSFATNTAKAKQRSDIMAWYKVFVDPYLPPKEILEATNSAVWQMCRENRDPFADDQLPELRVSYPYAQPNSSRPPDTIHTEIPLFSESDMEKELPVEWQSVQFREGNIYELAGRQIIIVVAGPPHSGKSTLAATLTIAMRDMIKSLCSRSGFSDLNLSVACADVDFSSPTSCHILERSPFSIRGQWNEETAVKAFWALASFKENIVIADLPGGLADEVSGGPIFDYIMEILVSIGHVSVFITKDAREEWKVRTPLWTEFLKKTGAYQLARIHSRPVGDPLQSAVTNLHNSEDFISGRITGPRHVAMTWDPFATFLSQFLLFDALPKFFRKQASKSRNKYRFLEEQKNLRK